MDLRPSPPHNKEVQMIMINEWTRPLCYSFVLASALYLASQMTFI